MRMERRRDGFFATARQETRAGHRLGSESEEAFPLIVVLLALAVKTMEDIGCLTFEALDGSDTIATLVGARCTSHRVQLDGLLTNERRCHGADSTSVDLVWRHAIDSCCHRGDLK